MSYLIMYWNWQISINDYMSKKCVSMSQCRLAYLFFLVFRTTWTWLTETCTSVLHSCCERESFPLLRLSPWSRCCPGCSQRHPLGAQDRCLPNAFPRVLVEALLTFVGENVLAILVQVVWLVKWSFR